MSPSTPTADPDVDLTAGAGPRAARILVVEDDEDIRDLILLRVQRAGYSGVGAASGREALRLCERQAPDAVVLDVGLPDMTGFELLQRLRERHGDGVPAVFLSAGTLNDHRERAARAGDEYLTKPFVAATLLQVLERSLRV